MLRKLKIKNFALIKELEIEPGKGFNIITGETGAGKSIIMNAVSLILGKRATSSFVRKGEKKLIVEAEFFPGDNINKFIIKNGYEAEEYLTITREISISGKGRIWINDSPAKSSLLIELGNLLIDLHGQHEHQSLLNNNIQLDIIDRFGGIDTFEIRKIFFEINNTVKELAEIKDRKKEKEERLELLKYHKKEIDELSVEEGEDSKILEELKTLENIEDIKKSGNKTESLEADILDKINELKKENEFIVSVNSEFEKFEDDLESAYISVSEFVSALSSYSNSIDFDEERFEFLNDRYFKIKKILKKFGPEVSDLLRYREEIETELSDNESLSENIEILERKVESLQAEYKKLAADISLKRKDISLNFKSKVESELKYLDLSQAELKICFKNEVYTEKGMDNIEFLIKTNVGGNFTSLAKTASGGEISRIMLAVKSVISEKEGVPVLIFDEIDTGISGDTARKVGNKIKELSKKRQIFAITHLPVIAAKGDKHFLVKKSVVDNSAVSVIEELNKDKRIDIISKMIGGEVISESSKKHAVELLNQ